MFSTTTTTSSYNTEFTSWVANQTEHEEYGRVIKEGYSEYDRPLDAGLVRDTIVERGGFVKLKASRDMRREVFQLYHDHHGRWVSKWLKFSQYLDILDKFVSTPEVEVIEEKRKLYWMGDSQLALNLILLTSELSSWEYTTPYPGFEGFCDLYPQEQPHEEWFEKHEFDTPDLEVHREKEFLTALHDRVSNDTKWNAHIAGYPGFLLPESTMNCDTIRLRKGKTWHFTVIYKGGEQSKVHYGVGDNSMNDRMHIRTVLQQTMKTANVQEIIIYAPSRLLDGNIEWVNTRTPPIGDVKDIIFIYGGAPPQTILSPLQGRELTSYTTLWFFQNVEVSGLKTLEKTNITDLVAEKEIIVDEKTKRIETVVDVKNSATLTTYRHALMNVRGITNEQEFKGTDEYKALRKTVSCLYPVLYTSMLMSGVENEKLERKFGGLKLIECLVKPLGRIDAEGYVMSVRNNFVLYDFLHANRLATLDGIERLLGSPSTDSTNKKFEYLKWPELEYKWMSSLCKAVRDLLYEVSINIDRVGDEVLIGTWKKLIEVRTINPDFLTDHKTVPALLVTGLVEMFGRELNVFHGTKQYPFKPSLRVHPDTWEMTFNPSEGFSATLRSTQKRARHI